MSEEKNNYKKLASCQMSKNNTFFPALDHLDKIMC